MYSGKSDVWAYGVTVWEIFSLGEEPYGSTGVMELLCFLQSGQRLEMPLFGTEGMLVIILFDDCNSIFHEICSLFSVTPRCKDVGTLIQTQDQASLSSKSFLIKWSEILIEKFEMVEVFHWFGFVYFYNLWPRKVDFNRIDNRKQICWFNVFLSHSH